MKIVVEVKTRETLVIINKFRSRLRYLEERKKVSNFSFLNQTFEEKKINLTNRAPLNHTRIL